MKQKKKKPELNSLNFVLAVMFTYTIQKFRVVKFIYFLLKLSEREDEEEYVSSP